jgi:xylulokinase
MKRYILAHDVGTSGNKATLFDEQGAMAASASASYGTHYFNGNWAEQRPVDWWKAVCGTSQEVLSRIDSSQLAGVSFSGQMMACLCVDEAGNPLHDALIYCDQRSARQERELIDACGMENVYQITGHRPSASYTLTKLMWIRDNKPDIFKKTYKVLQAKDYINFRLTAEFATDFNDASGTNAFDLHTSSWSQKILNAVSIPLEIFPEAVPSTTVIGKVHRRASAESGIPEGTPVVIGAGDGGCATLGAGSVVPGKPYCYMGSSSWVSITSKKPLIDKQMRSFTWAHPIEGLYQPCATMQTAGSSFSWFAKILSGSDGAEELQEINKLAQQAPPGANGVLFLPYLLGERSPWWNSQAKAEFIGLHVNTTRSDISRAVIEGIAMNLNLSLQIMLQETGERSVMFIGGGAQGEIWRRIFADVFGCSITIPSLLTEATSMGAALLGGVGTGVYKDFSMVEQMNPVVEEIRRDQQSSLFYRELSDVLVASYKAVEPLFARIDGLNVRFGV